MLNNKTLNTRWKILVSWAFIQQEIKLIQKASKNVPQKNINISNQLNSAINQRAFHLFNFFYLILISLMIFLSHNLVFHLPNYFYHKSISNWLSVAFPITSSCIVSLLLTLLIASNTLTLLSNINQLLLNL